MPRIDYNAVCKRCLRDFQFAPHLLASHSARCRLPYSQNVAKGKTLAVYCLSPETPIRERRFAADSVVNTMHASSEVPSDSIGWYSKMDKSDWETYRTHAYVAVVNGWTAGTVIVNRKRACRVNYSAKGKMKVGKCESEPRWSICRIWIALPFRGRGIAQRTVKAIARHLGVKATELAWMVPLTAGGELLARSIGGDALYQTA